jgi:hypothetical protein
MAQEGNLLPIATDRVQVVLHAMELEKINAIIATEQERNNPFKKQT